MPSSSYIRNNDYQVNQFKPYNLPYDSLMKSMSAKTSYWEQGVAEMQNQYSKVLGLDPLFQQNKEYLKTFLSEAETKLNKLGKSDLSLQDNRSQISKIFQPLYDTSNEFNANLLKDSQLNSFYKEQDKLSQRLKTQDGGKSWNQDNDFYWKTEYQKYANSASSGEDPSSINKYYEKRKGFVPYYDYTDDLTQAIKNCHSSSETSMDVAGSYGMLFTTKSNKGISASQMQSCINFLPEKAKQQIGISAYRQYYGNNNELLTDYKNYIVDDAKDYLTALDSKIAALSIDKKKNKPIIDQLLQERIAFDKRVQDGDKTWNTIMSGKDPLKYIEDNYDNLTYALGNQYFNKRAGETFQWQDIENKLSTNAAGIAMFNQMGRERLEEIGFQNDIKLNTQEFGYQQSLQNDRLKADLLKEGLDANGNFIAQGSGITPTEEVKKINGDISFSELRDEADKEATKAVDGLQRAIGSVIDDPSTPKEVRDSFYKLFSTKGEKSTTTLINFVDQYSKSGVKNPSVEAALADFRNKADIVSSLRDEEKAARNKVKNMLPSENNINEFNLSIPIAGPLARTDTKVAFTDRQIADMLDGKQIMGFKIRKGDVFGRGDLTKYVLTMPDGLEVGSLVNPKFETKVANVEQTIAEYSKALSKELENKINTPDKLFTTGERSKKEIDNRNIKLKNDYNIPEGIDIGSSYRDLEGNLIFRLNKMNEDTKESSPLSASDLIKLALPVEKFKTRGDKEETFVKVPFYSQVEGQDLIKLNRINSYIEANRLESTYTFGRQNGLEITGNNGRRFRIKFQTTPNGENIYQLERENKGMWLKEENIPQNLDLLVNYINVYK